MSSEQSQQEADSLFDPLGTEQRATEAPEPEEALPTDPSTDESAYYDTETQYAVVKHETGRVHISSHAIDQWAERAHPEAPPIWEALAESTKDTEIVDNPYFDHKPTESPTNGIFVFCCESVISPPPTMLLICTDPDGYEDVDQLIVTTYPITTIEVIKVYNYFSEVATQIQNKSEA